MSRRVFVLILALAAALLAPACATKTVRGVGNPEWERKAFERFTLLDFKLRRVYFQMASIEDEVRAEKESGGDTTLVDPGAIEDELSNACEDLQAAIRAIEAEIARLKNELASMAATAEGVLAYARIAGMAKDLSEIEDKVISVKESGGDAQPGLVYPASCQEALAKLEELQAELSALADLVKKMQDELATGTP